MSYEYLFSWALNLQKYEYTGTVNCSAVCAKEVRIWAAILVGAICDISKNNKRK